VNVIDPRGLDARDWIDYTGDNLVSLVPIFRVETGDEWRRWGDYVRQVLNRRGIIVPAPEGYADWIEWAFRFNQVIALVRGN
jgi:hypothetical protein